jgi:uncharacterized lipoprotein YddW (UPF0748 family)
MKIIKENKRFKRDNARKLQTLGTKFNSLSSIVNESLTVVKKEKERFKKEQQENLLRMFQQKAAQAAEELQSSSSEII